VDGIRAEDQSEAQRAKHRVTVLGGLAIRHQAYTTITKLLQSCRVDGPMPGDLEHWLKLAEAAALQLNPLADGLRSMRDVVEKQVDEKMRRWEYYEPFSWDRPGSP
jgi:hypothetical protein